MIITIIQGEPIASLATNRLLYGNHEYECLCVQVCVHVIKALK